MSNLALFALGCQLLLPFLVALSIHLYNWLLSRLPAAQQDRVKSLIRSVVMAVEQSCSAMDGPAKKQEAIRMIDLALTKMGLPLPPAALLDILIEQAVYAVNQQAPLSDATQSVPAVSLK